MTTILTPHEIWMYSILFINLVLAWGMSALFYERKKYPPQDVIDWTVWLFLLAVMALAFSVSLKHLVDAVLVYRSVS